MSTNSTTATNSSTTTTTTIQLSTGSPSASSSSSQSYSSYVFSPTYQTTIFDSSSHDELIILRVTQLLGLLCGLLGNSLSTFFSIRIQTAAEMMYYQKKLRVENGCDSSVGFEPLVSSPIVSIPVSGGGESSSFSFPSSVDALVGNSVIVFGLFIVHWILPKLVSCCGKFRSIRQHGAMILAFHRLVTRLAWLFYFSLLHTSISFGVRLVDTRSSASSRSLTDGEIAIGSILGIALPCLLTLFAAFRRFDVKWSPVGAWVGASEDDNELSKRHGLDLFPELTIQKTDDGKNDDDDDEDNNNQQPKPEPTMTLEDALLGSPSTAAFAMKSVIEKRQRSDEEHKAEEVEKERAARKFAKENRRRKFLEGEVRGGKWINNIVVTIDEHDEEESSSSTSSKEKKPKTIVAKKINSSSHKLRYGPLFMDFRINHQRFFVVQLLVSIITGTLHGLATFDCANFQKQQQPSGMMNIIGIQTSDDAFTFTIAVVLAIEALVFISLQPCRFFLDNLFFTFVLLGSNAAAGCALLVTSSGRLSGLAEYFIQVTECIIFALFCIKFLADLLLRITQATQCCCFSSTDGVDDVDEDRIWEKEFAILGIDVNKDDDGLADDGAEEKNTKQNKEIEEKAAGMKNTNNDDKQNKNLADLGAYKQQSVSLGSATVANNPNSSSSTFGIQQDENPSRSYSISSGNRIVVLDQYDADASPLRTFNRLEDEKYAKKHGLTTRTSSFNNKNNNGELDWDYDEQEREMRIIATKNTIERLQTYASKPHVELDGDDELTKEEKRKARRGLPPGLDSFLSLTPPDDKNNKKQSSGGGGVALQPNGLAEGITMGPPIAFGDLRLDYSPNYSEERAPDPETRRKTEQQNNNRRPTVTFKDENNNNEGENDEGSPVAPLRAALRNLKGLDQDPLVEEMGKQTNEMRQERQQQNDSEKDEEFSFSKSLGSRPGEEQTNESNRSNDDKNENEEQARRLRAEKSRNEHDDDDDDDEEDNEHEPPLMNNNNNNDNNEDASPRNPFADLNQNRDNADEIMQRLDSGKYNNNNNNMIVGMDINSNNKSTGFDINNGNNISNSAAKRLRSLELAGNFLTGAFSVPPLPIMQQHSSSSSSRKRTSNFRDPYYDEFYGARNEDSSSSPPQERNHNNRLVMADYEEEEELPYPLPPVRIDKDDYYGAANNNSKNNNNHVSGAHAALNEYSPGQVKKDLQQMMKQHHTAASAAADQQHSGYENANTRPLFSGYFAPTPAAKQQRQGAAGGGGVHEEFLGSPSPTTENTRYQKHQPPLRNTDAQRPLMKMFAMQHGVLGNNNNHKGGNAFVSDANNANFYSSMTPAEKERQKQMDAFFFSPAGNNSNNNHNQDFSPPNGVMVNHHNIINIPVTPTPSRKTFAKVEEL